MGRMPKTRKEYRIRQRQSKGWTNPHLKLMEALTKEGIRFYSEKYIGVIDDEGKPWNLRVDLLVFLNFPGSKGLVVEVHGERFHSSKAAIRKDEWKEKLLKREGYRRLVIWASVVKTKKGLMEAVTQIKEAMKNEA